MQCNQTKHNLLEGRWLSKSRRTRQEDVRPLDMRGLLSRFPFVASCFPGFLWSTCRQVCGDRWSSDRFEVNEWYVGWGISGHGRVQIIIFHGEQRQRCGGRLSRKGGGRLGVSTGFYPSHMFCGAHPVKKRCTILPGVQQEPQFHLASDRTWIVKLG